MRNITVARTVAAPRSSVWAVLADYPNIADWNDGVMTSYAIGDATEGVGAQRQTVAKWVPEEKMVIAIDKVEKMLAKQATQAFTLSGRGETTQFEMSFDYEPKGGPLALIYGPMLDRQMRKGFNGFIDNLEATAQARAAT